MPRDIRSECAGCRVQFRWPGFRRALNGQQQDRAASPFGAARGALHSSKVLLDSKYPQVRVLTAIRGRIRGYWHGNTLPYVQDGVRLLLRDEVDTFDAEMRRKLIAFNDAKGDLRYVWPDMKARQRERLADLYDPTDYPDDPTGEFGVEWDFPPLEPPDYLKTLSPRVYEAECAAAHARFNEAIRLSQDAFVEEFRKMISHLRDRLTDGPEGPKRLYDSAIENLQEFFGRFSKLNVRNSADLDEIVEQARRCVGSAQMDELRDDATRRTIIKNEMARVEAALDASIELRPRRLIL